MMQEPLHSRMYTQRQKLSAPNFVAKSLGARLYDVNKPYKYR